MDSEDRAGAWDLVTAAKAGDRTAYGQLWALYHPMVLRYVRSRVLNHALAEDLAGETFLRGLRRVESLTYQGDSGPGAWFVTIARNLILDHVKRSDTRLTTPAEDIRDVAAGVDTEDLALRELELAALRADLEVALAALPADQWETIKLRFFDGLSTAETAAATGRGVAASKAMQHRAIVGLRQLLAA